MKGRLDYATAFPGILFSTVLLGVVVVFLVLFVVLTVLSVPAFYTKVLWGFKVTIVWLVLSYLVMQLLTRLVLDKLCLKDGEVTTFAAGACLALSRLVMMPFMFVRFHNLSTTMLREEFCCFDGGFAAFLSLVRHNHEVQNPIRCSFLAAIAPESSRLHGQPPLETPRPQTVRQRVRNRLWVGLLMHHAPQLSASRKRALAEARELPGECSAPKDV